MNLPAGKVICGSWPRNYLDLNELSNCWSYGSWKLAGVSWQRLYKALPHVDVFAVILHMPGILWIWHVTDPQA